MWDGRGDWRELVCAAPPGKVTLVMMIGEAKLLREWEAYMASTQRAFDCIQTGKSKLVPPGDFVIRQQSLPPWAPRRFV